MHASSRDSMLCSIVLAVVMSGCDRQPTNESSGTGRANDQLPGDTRPLSGETLLPMGTSPADTTSTGSNPTAVVDPAAGGAPDAGAAPEATFDRQFIDMIVPHHESAIEMAKVAATRAEREEIKTAANKMVESQQKDIEELRTLRERWYGSRDTPSIEAMPMLPGVPHHEMPDMKKQMERLRQEKPFDKAFIDVMVPHHQMGLDAARLVEQKTTRSELKQLAGKMAAEQQKEIDELRTWRARWYPEKRR